MTRRYFARADAVAHTPAEDLTPPTTSAPPNLTDRSVA